MEREYKPLDDEATEQIANLTNQVLHSELKDVCSLGINILKVKPVQVKAALRALWLYNLAVEKIDATPTPEE